MGVAKAWRLLPSNLALWVHPNGKHVCWTGKPISWSMVCGVMLFGLGLISLLTGHMASDIEWYSQRFVHRSLYSTMDGSDRAPIDIWKSQYSKYYYGCKERGRHFAPAVRESKSNGYLLIATSGGLNQQRTGITDAVVVARILNATLVVPELDHHSFWKDESDFNNIFDVNWFITYLAKDVTIVKRVPDKVMRSMEKPPYTMRVPRKSDPEYYLDQVLPILFRRRVLQLTKFDYRLANNLDDELQKLRCRVNYHALRFTKPIRQLGQKIVMRMRKMANRFIAVHLRFEPDMLAFSGCYFGGGEKERRELGEIRKRWTTLPDLSPDGERKRGKCPLTPHEVGLMLRALGFTNDTYLYVASGEIYGGNETMQPLKDLFPNFYTKEMLAPEELKPFLPFSSRLAAIDYIVCDESNVFVTNNNGNMAKILAGRRRYMGHKRTIRPNAKKLSTLFMERHQMGWDTFARKVKTYQRGFMGEPDEMRPGRGEFHEYPSTCVCEKPFIDEELGKDGYRPPKLAAENLTEKVDLTIYGGNEESPLLPNRSWRRASQQKNVVDSLVPKTQLLESKIQEAKSKKDTLKARAQSAKTATKISEMVSNISTSSALAAFDKMEEKVLSMEAQADALNQLTTDNLEGKFALLENSSVDDDLAALKKEISGSSKRGELPPGRSVSTNKEFLFPDLEVEKELNELRRKAKGF